MNWIERWSSRGRVKDARRKVANEPTVAHYLALAGEHARIGEMAEAERVCLEGVEAFGANAELVRLADRCRALQDEQRTRELTRQLREAPRAGLYRELAELHLRAGRSQRAEDVAAEWLEQGGEGAAQLLRAQARIARYLADRRREDGRLAFEFLDAAEHALPRDERPLRMRLELLCSIGAWRDARRAVGQLLELTPGDPALEARFRTYNSLVDKAPTLDAALREVERSGRLSAERAPSHAAPAPTSSGAIRPMLQELASQPAVLAALYERGATALVQGPTGATAERTARALREVVQRSRSTGRRLGLGALLEVELEGSFGSVMVVPGDGGAAAVCTSLATVPEELRSRVRALQGAGAPEREEQP